ncbi:MAG: ABC transporter permease, partial [Actinobacteria bacterium]
AGTGSLIRLILRRDRWVMGAWVLWLGVLPMVTASAWTELYPTQADIVRAALQLGSNPALSAMFGPVFDASIGGLTAWRLSIYFVIIGVVSLLTVIRHTRVEEETGRRELIGSTVVGRHAPLTAALLTVMAADLVVAGIIATGLIALDLPVTGSVAFSAAVAGSGIFFAAVGGVAAQLTETAGGARAIALSVLGLSYVLRAAGDAAGGERAAWPSWLSPIGWLIHLRSFGDERWWALVLTVVVAAAVTAAAFAIAARRDVASGVLPPRLGPAAASPSLAGPIALAWRLHKGALIGWTVGFAVLGVIYGSVAEGVGGLLEDSPDLQEIFARLGGTRVIIDAYLAGIVSVLALIVAAYGIQAASRPRSEEDALRAEPVLATAVPRTAWLASHLIFAFAAPALALLTGGLTMGLAYGAVAGDVVGETPRLLGAALAQLPAVWVLVAIVILLFGLAPRLMAVTWVLYSALVLITFLGPVLQLSHWILDLSPFTHIPKLPGAELVMPPLLWLLALVVVLSAAGVGGFRRRDIG